MRIRRSGALVGPGEGRRFGLPLVFMPVMKLALAPLPPQSRKLIQGPLQRYKHLGSTLISYSICPLLKKEYRGVNE